MLLLLNFSLSNFAMEKNYTQLDPIKLCENYYEIPFLNPNIKDFDSIKNSLETVSIESNKLNNDFYA